MVSASETGDLFEHAKSTESRDSAATLDAQALAQIADAAMCAAVDVGWSKREAFADDLGIANSDLSLRLNRKTNQRLKVQTWDSGEVVEVMKKRTALFTLLQRLGAPFGIQCTLVDTSDPDYVRRELAKELPDKRRRQWEREHGKPEGWLDR